MSERWDGLWFWWRWRCGKVTEERVIASCCKGVSSCETVNKRR